MKHEAQELLKSLDAGDNALLNDMIRSVSESMKTASEEESERHAVAFLMFVREFMPEALEGVEVGLPDSSLEKEDGDSYQTHLKNVLADNGHYYFGPISKHMYGIMGSGPGRMDVRGYGPRGKKNPKKSPTHSNAPAQADHGRGSGTRDTHEEITGIVRMLSARDGDTDGKAKAQYDALSEQDKRDLDDIEAMAEEKGITLPSRTEMEAMSHEDLVLLADKLGLLGETRGGTLNVVDSDNSDGKDGFKRRARDISGYAPKAERGAGRNLKQSDNSGFKSALDTYRKNKQRREDGQLEGNIADEDRRLGTISRHDTDTHDKPRPGMKHRVSAQEQADAEAAGIKPGMRGYGTKDQEGTAADQPDMTENKYKVQQNKQKLKQRAKLVETERAHIDNLISGDVDVSAGKTKALTGTTVNEGDLAAAGGNTGTATPNAEAESEASTESVGPVETGADMPKVSEASDEDFARALHRSRKVGSGRSPEFADLFTAFERGEKTKAEVIDALNADSKRVEDREGVKPDTANSDIEGIWDAKIKGRLQGVAQILDNKRRLKGTDTDTLKKIDADLDKYRATQGVRTPAHQATLAIQDKVKAEIDRRQSEVKPSTDERVDGDSEAATPDEPASQEEADEFVPGETKHEGETWTSPFGDFVYDVGGIWDAIVKDGRKPNWVMNPQDKKNLFAAQGGTHGVDPDKAMADEVDTNVPAILVMPPPENFEGHPYYDRDGNDPREGALLVDGSHRVYKAIKEGQTSMPAYVISHEEAAKYIKSGFTGKPIDKPGPVTEGQKKFTLEGAEASHGKGKASAGAAPEGDGADEEDTPDLKIKVKKGLADNLGSAYNKLVYGKESPTAADRNRVTGDKKSRAAKDKKLQEIKGDHNQVKGRNLTGLSEETIAAARGKYAKNDARSGKGSVARLHEIANAPYLTEDQRLEAIAERISEGWETGLGINDPEGVSAITGLSLEESAGLLGAQRDRVPVSEAKEWADKFFEASYYGEGNRPRGRSKAEWVREAAQHYVEAVKSGDTSRASHPAGTPEEKEALNGLFDLRGDISPDEAMETIREGLKRLGYTDKDLEVTGSTDAPDEEVDDSGTFGGGNTAAGEDDDFGIPAAPAAPVTRGEPKVTPSARVRELAATTAGVQDPEAAVGGGEEKASAPESGKKAGPPVKASMSQKVKDDLLDRISISIDSMEEMTADDPFNASLVQEAFDALSGPGAPSMSPDAWYVVQEYAKELAEDTLGKYNFLDRSDPETKADINKAKRLEALADRILDNEDIEAPEWWVKAQEEMAADNREQARFMSAINQGKTPEEARKIAREARAKDEENAKAKAKASGADAPKVSSKVEPSARVRDLASASPRKKAKLDEIRGKGSSEDAKAKMRATLSEISDRLNGKDAT